MKTGEMKAVNQKQNVYKLMQNKNKLQIVSKK